MIRLKVDNDALAEEFFDGTRLLGIVGPIKDYQFCWQLNQAMQIDLRVNHDIEIALTRKKRNYFFSIYEYAEPTGFLVHYLYNNQFDGEYLLPEFKHLDFLWLMKGDTMGDSGVTALVQSIKQIPGVQLVMELSTEKIKNKGHLIF
jgi:hypothetical protein